MKRAVSLITETAAWLTSLSGALAQKYICTKTKIQLHTKNTTAQRQKYNYTKKKWKHSIPKTQPREHQQAEYHLLSMFVFKRRILNDSLQITQKVLGFCASDTYIMSLRGQYS